MRLSIATVLLYLNVLALTAPPSTPNSIALLVRDDAFSDAIAYNDLEKRRGGGGGKGGGGGAGSGGKGGTGGSGGSVRSGTPPAYGNRYYGGASSPYTAGGKTPTRGISPALYPIGAFGFFPAFWIFPVYAYPYGYGYSWNDHGRNRTSNVTCLCQEYSECGCDPDGNSTFLAQQLTNGQSSGAPVNSTNVRTIDWPNGSTISYINGTLANGTTLGDGSGAARLMANFGGYWLMIAMVIAGVTLI